MRYLFLSSFLFLFLLQVQSQSSKDQAVEISVQHSANGDINFMSNNKDYCDYYVILNVSEIRGYSANTPFPYKRVMKPGNQRILTLKRLSDSSSPYYSWRYSVYKGNDRAKLNLDYVYSLPTKTGDSLRITTSNDRDYTLIFNLKNASDTIFASREGRICDSSLSDQTVKTANTRDNKVIVYHKDDSFAEYSLIDEPLVNPGDYVEIGQPIAIVKTKKNSNNKDQKNVKFSVYYLDKNKVQDRETGHKHSSLIPTFYTVDYGNVKLDEKTTYIAGITDDMITQEMSDKEKKKYEEKKNKGK